MSKTAEKSEENFERVLRRMERGDVGSDELQKASSNIFSFNFQKLTHFIRKDSSVKLKMEAQEASNSYKNSIVTFFSKNLHDFNY